MAGAFVALGGTFAKGAGTFLPSLTPAPPPGVAAGPEAAVLVAAVLEVGVAVAVLPGVAPGTDTAGAGTCDIEGAVLAAEVASGWAGAGAFSTACRSCGLAA